VGEYHPLFTALVSLPRSANSRPILLHHSRMINRPVLVLNSRKTTPIQPHFGLHKPQIHQRARRSFLNKTERGPPIRETGLWRNSYVRSGQGLESSLRSDSRSSLRFARRCVSFRADSIKSDKAGWPLVVAGVGVMVDCWSSILFLPFDGWGRCLGTGGVAALSSPTSFSATFRYTSRSKFNSLTAIKCNL
jgi:hypothetical protein